ncbi:hypothetical protein EYF80_019867 [Liparis tanakae]|uniref:Uncharacterized protein n=1 Tax=Liparis tanakae TaxID=230148 RepID=A0A4Z2HY98_9TELE|nr:hypothetical protein EYF80_019867 [Liparis tanakae]
MLAYRVCFCVNWADSRQNSCCWATANERISIHREAEALGAAARTFKSPSADGSSSSLQPGPTPFGANYLRGIIITCKNTAGVCKATARQPTQSLPPGTWTPPSKLHTWSSSHSSPTTLTTFDLYAMLVGVALKAPRSLRERVGTQGRFRATAASGKSR